MEATYYNEDCIEGCKKRIPSNSVDLIITDPPFGIKGDTLDKHYNRDSSLVLDGYVEVPQAEYPRFTQRWIEQAARILRPGGSIYIISGYTNLYDVLNALRATPLVEVNHIIWRYSFGVYTSRKYVSSHYHILYYWKPTQDSHLRTFNLECRYSKDDRDFEGGSLNYQDREDVWIIGREYKTGQVRVKNQLPDVLLRKMLQYSSNEGDLICDLFMGSFSTARVALGMGRYVVGFEISKELFDHFPKGQR